jgi:hypothetical protein
LFENDEEMIFWVAGEASGADEDEEGSVGGDLGIYVGGGAVAEGKWLGWLIVAAFGLRCVETLAAFLVDGGEIDGAVRCDAWLPDGEGGEVDGVGEAFGLAPCVA